MSASDPDVALMLRVKEGDEEAFRELVEKYQRSVINTFYRSIGDAWEAEDLAQRVFLQVYRSADRYQPIAKFKTWLFTIVHNLIVNELHRRSRHVMGSLDEQLNCGSDTDNGSRSQQFADSKTLDPGEETANRELVMNIQDAIKRLPSQQRTAVIMCRFEGLSYEEIGSVLDCSVSAVKSLLHRARETLKENLRGQY